MEATGKPHLGDIQETTGRPHLGERWKTTKRQKDSLSLSLHRLQVFLPELCSGRDGSMTGRQHLGNHIWETTGRPHLGDKWKTIGRPHLYDNWETTGRQVEYNWETIGRHLEDNWNIIGSCGRQLEDH